ncbi:hypothetical protein CHS0354_028389 [Potamilus streckersoni]|uniref:Uncharacterized protein n=1 Tax=Potamilus streckersoni TaxID=2493646 RepID=A0AAE0RTX7_9BIVA|nr:hypothetical protein CHS0354_028389 [Potamilus streckersoni]
MQPGRQKFSYVPAKVSGTDEVKMPFAKASMFSLTVLIVAIQAQWSPDDSGTYLVQTGLRLRNQLQNRYSLSNLGLRTHFSRRNGGSQAGFFQQQRSVPLPSTTISRISHRSIPTVDSELLGPNEGIDHYSPVQFQNFFDPELLGPNEGIGHDDPIQFTNVLRTGLGVSSRTVSNRDDTPISPYLIPGRISPFRGPKGDVVLPPILPNRFNRLPELGGKGDAVTSSGENINILNPRSRRLRDQFGH